MPFLNFRYKPKNELEPGGRSTAPVHQDESEPEQTCPNCHKSIPVSRLWAAQNTCPCGYHFRVTARQRIGMLTDQGSFQELFGDLQSSDPLAFPGYQKKLETARLSSNELEAVLCGTASIGGEKCCFFAMEPGFTETTAPS